MSSRQTRKVKKPRLIAYGKTGYYGDIHYPTLPCKDAKRTPKPEEDYVSKSMSRSEALHEIRKTSDWRKKGFDFALVPEDFCEGEGTLRTGQGKERKSLQEQRYLLISKYGGQTAREFGKEMVEQGRRIIKYLDALIDLRKKVAEMNKEHFYHNDITDLNVTYDEAKGKAFLIDFEHADREAPQAATPKSNNSPVNLDLDHETNLIDNNIIGVFLDKLKEIGLVIPMKQTTSRSSRSTSSSRTRTTKKIYRPHSI
jgi:hypothetical protein